MTQPSQLARQAGLALIFLAGGLAVVDQVSAEVWTQTTATGSGFESVASSADGSKLMAVGDALVYVSTNFGVTWTQMPSPMPPSDTLAFLAISADGSKVAAVSFGALSFTSTNFGVSWTSNSVPGINLTGIAASADGNTVVTMTGSKPSFTYPTQVAGPIFVSTNFGADWTISGAPSNLWSCVAASADGSRLAAGTVGATNYGPQSDGLIFVSTNTGTTWLQTSAPSNGWSSIASSADGMKLAATSYPAVYTSADGGATWTSNNLPLEIWQVVTMAADGSRLAAANQAGQIWTSTNFGASWVSNSINPTPWDMCSSADGNTLAMAQIAGGIWISQTTPAPRLNLAPANGGLNLAWLVPSTNFVAQESFDLVNWTDLTNAPVLNLTNLQYQASIQATNHGGFYRLAVP